jgi:hypothetical protein
VARILDLDSSPMNLIRVGQMYPFNEAKQSRTVLLEIIKWNRSTEQPLKPMLIKLFVLSNYCDEIELGKSLWTVNWLYAQNTSTQEGR